jgi:hypothetical protein
MKTLRNLALTKFLPVAMGAICFLPLANAQTGFQGKFTLQEQVRWGRATLPPGNYTVTLGSSGMPNTAILRSGDRKRTLLVVAGAHGDARSRGSYLVITGFGRQRHVTSLNLGEQGISLIYDLGGEHNLQEESSLTRSETYLNLTQK